MSINWNVQNQQVHRAWSGAQRFGVWLLAATSIACLMTEFYQVCPMRTFTLAIFIPALIILAVWTGFDAVRVHRIFVPVMIGAVSGLLAAVSYDIFRLPFVFSKQWGLTGIVPALNLYKVFPAFGAMILGQPYPQAEYQLSAELLGWAYHFSNGLTFGVMYLAMVGNPLKRHWAWAVVFAVGLELAMLFTPYPKAFGIPVTSTFVWATLTAHLIFGVAMGLISRRLWARFEAPRAISPLQAA